MTHPEAARAELIGKSVIEIGGDADHPDAVRDVAVWRYGWRSLGGLQFTEISVDWSTGQVVRVTGW